MSSKQQSEQSSASSSPIPRPPPRSLIVSKVPTDKDESSLYDDLNYNYRDVKKISRNHDQDGNALSSIRIDFHSVEVVSEILNEDAIYIENRRHFIRPYWPRVCYRCQNEGHVAAECPQQSLPEWRLAELLQQQNTDFETMINAFEKRWNRRLSSLQTLSKKTNFNNLLPVVNDLNTVCNQMNQQNSQMQKQIVNIANHIQNLQPKVTD